MSVYFVAFAWYTYWKIGTVDKLLITVVKKLKVYFILIQFIKCVQTSSYDKKAVATSFYRNNFVTNVKPKTSVDWKISSQ